MRMRHSCSRNGQALIMVTLALLAMSGFIGMVVDFGWSYFMRRAMQSAADAAALAAANSAMDAMSNNSARLPGAPGTAPALPTTAAQPCTTTFSNNLQSACLYGEQNGFSAGQIQVSADTTSPYPPGVYTSYWVKVQISSSIPQLFSAILGNAYATVSASATAAIFDSPVSAWVVAMNRVNDVQPIWLNTPPTGANPDIMAGSGSSLAVPGVTIASTDSYSGYNVGNLPTPVPIAQSRGGLQGSPGNWSTSSTQGQGDTSMYYDPFRGMGQPPLTSTPFNPNQFFGVPNGVLDQSVSACNTGVCSPGVYYATTTNNGVTSPTGERITVSSSLNFGVPGSSTAFGDYVFYGGLTIDGSNAPAVNFGPGRYVMAGVLPSNMYNLNITAGATITSGSTLDEGRLFILTNPNYPGLQEIAQVPGLNTSQLVYGQAAISGTDVRLIGLNSLAGQSLPTDTNQQSSTLADFGPVVIWQDQGFSTVAYTASGNINISCGSLEQPCTNPAPAISPKLTFGTNTHTNIQYGVVYQPRGAWTQLQPSATVLGRLILITGALDLGNNSTIRPGARPPLTVHRVALVQ